MCFVSCGCLYFISCQIEIAKEQECLKLMYVCSNLLLWPLLRKILLPPCTFIEFYTHLEVTSQNHFKMVFTSAEGFHILYFQKNDFFVNIVIFWGTIPPHCHMSITFLSNVPHKSRGLRVRIENGISIKKKIISRLSGLVGSDCCVSCFSLVVLHSIIVRTCYCYKMKYFVA